MSLFDLDDSIGTGSDYESEYEPEPELEDEYLKFLNELDIDIDNTPHLQASPADDKPVVEGDVDELDLGDATYIGIMTEENVEVRVEIPRASTAPKAPKVNANKRIDKDKDKDKDKNKDKNKHEDKDKDKAEDKDEDEDAVANAMFALYIHDDMYYLLSDPDPDSDNTAADTVPAPFRGSLPLPLMDIDTSESARESEESEAEGTSSDDDSNDNGWDDDDSDDSDNDDSDDDDDGSDNSDSELESLYGPPIMRRQSKVKRTLRATRVYMARASASASVSSPSPSSRRQSPLWMTEAQKKARKKWR
ncbi:hypothetical protein JR316_0012387 [Psilocybe cubensis]|uniref:Uncharacterized protein n=2 Tax=Psilocybe cubensis TaxID=181762 RepID=A0ACB8GID5_PSICU|nr:hypothetical protein JR316_0012387 [Psilocybe cubensis]KAH9475276.1 hypothetical protein JR316_0012387 [Psilocybe cubensis]